MKLNLKDLNILILTHYFAYGPAYDLEYYLRNKVRNLTIIEIPLYLRFDSPIKLRSYNQDNEITWAYEKEINVTFPLSLSPYNKNMSEFTRIAQYLTILIDRLIGGLCYDITIAEDPITTFLAIILRKIGKTRHVIFQSHAYTAPQWGNLYELVDYYATRNSDVVWALSNRLVRIRKALGAKYVIHTPICIRDDIISLINDCYEEKENAAVYVGALNKDKGVDVLLKLIPQLIKIFDRIYIVGAGHYEKIIRELNKKLKNNKIKYFGRLPLERSVQIVRRSLLGLVLTRPSLESLTTDPMKPKVYIASHTPLIIPKYFELSKFVEKFSAGLTISNFSRDYITNRILEFLRKPNNYVKGAVNMARYFNYWKCSRVLEITIKKTLATLL